MSDRDSLARWFHTEFGGLRCVHDSKVRPQCEAWADQFLRTGPKLGQRDLAAKVEAVLTNNAWGSLMGEAVRIRDIRAVLADAQTLEDK